MSNLEANIFSDHQYYVITSTEDILKVSESSFLTLDKRVKTLIYQEYYGRVPEQWCTSRNEINQALRKNGFEWDELSECGHMKKRPEATTITEAIEKYVWKMVNDFCNDYNIPLHRIHGGELLSLSNPQISKLYKLISRIPSYGNNQYTWSKSNHNGLLRYSACLQKLTFANEIEKNQSNLPIGIYEVSKSYRDEADDTLQLCERVKSFYLPEMHILAGSFQSGMEIAKSAHDKILENLNSLYHDCIIFCKMTNSFFIKNMGFVKSLAESGKIVVLWVLKKDELCNNGVEIDIEYKVTDLSGAQIEIATLQIDKGTSEFALDVKYLNDQRQYELVSTIHSVFFGSIERAAYCLIDIALKNLKNGMDNQLPIWVAPIQARIVPINERYINSAKAFACELERTGCRVDVDDRQIPFNDKINCSTLNWVPFLIIITDTDKTYKFSENYKHGYSNQEQLSKSEIFKKIEKAMDMRLFVPRYTPQEVSRKFLI